MPGGVLATIYPEALPYSVPVRGGSRWRVDRAALPALMVAHEIGHLLGQGHASSGFMRATLSLQDLLTPVTP